MQETDYKTVGELAGITQTPPQTGKKRKLFFPILVVVGFTILITGLLVLYLQSTQLSADEANAEVISSLVEINDLENFSNYKDEAAGLYENATNEPDITAKITLQKQIEKILPRNLEGNINNDGRIGFVYIGNDYTKGEFTNIKEISENYQDINREIVFIDGVSEGQNLKNWSVTSYPWDVLKNNIEKAKISEKQVQVFWINFGFDETSGEFSENKALYIEELQKVVEEVLVKYPNVAVIYLSSPRYSGFSKLDDIKEPYSYEAAFGVRELINKQVRGDLVFSEKISRLTAEPALIWGPYMWNSSAEGGEDFSYLETNYAENGVSFLLSGANRYAVDVLDFFRDYEYSKEWFTTQE